MKLSDNATLPDRLLETLDELKASLADYQVSRCEHSLQSATHGRRIILSPVSSAGSGKSHSP